MTDKNIDIIKLIIDTKQAYNESSFYQVIKNVFINSKILSKVIISVLLIVMFCPVTLMITGKVSENVMIFSTVTIMITIMFLLEKELKIQYKFLYNEYDYKIKFYSINRQYFRYLIFTSKIPQTIILNSEYRTKVNEIIQKENELLNISIVKQYPIFTVLFVILTALINGLSSQTHLWKNGTLPSFTAIVLVLLFLSWQIASILKTKEFYNKELVLFLSWLENDSKAYNKTLERSIIWQPINYFKRK